MNCNDIEQFSFAPMIKVEIRILKIVAHECDVLLDVFSFLELGVSKNHFGFVTLDVVGKIEFFILVKHLKEYFVIGVALTFVLHVLSNTFDHALQNWDNLL